jgi:mRNA interferase MazF
MLIHQGDVYWLKESTGTESVPHPYLVIQENSLNHDESTETILVCALTTNMKKISVAGNILLEVGEANLSKQSIVEVSKSVSIEKRQLGGYIGRVSEKRVQQILEAIQFVENSFFRR